MKHLAEPLTEAMAGWQRAVAAKNAAVFRGIGGFDLPQPDDANYVIGTAVLLAMHRQCAGQTYAAIGEKTPENVFLFARLKRLFPAARFIGIVRDPRDVLNSAWHFFHAANADREQDDAKLAFVRVALPSLQEGTRVMLALAEQYPGECAIVTYERMLRATPAVAAELFRFLGVSDDDDLVAACVADTSFAALSGGRAAGETQEGSFFRKGVAGDWRSTFSPAMNDMILRELGWMFPRFGWEA